MVALFYKKAEELNRKHPNIRELIVAIQGYLHKHFAKLGFSYKAHSILESRFIPPEIAFGIGMRSCGAITNIATEMLRHVGYEVKKVHGSVPQSPDHSWISVKNPKRSVWEQYDLTRPNCEITPQHKVIKVCDDWEDIAKDLEEAHFCYITKQ